MKLTIKTELLKEAISKATKGASNNKLIPITGLIAIIAKDGKLKLITTDATNYLYISVPLVSADDFYAVVDVDIFSKLISKLSCDEVILEIGSDAILHVVGNGNYKIELPLDEDGSAIKYPDPLANVDVSSMTQNNLKRTTVQVIADTIKPALATTLEEPCYTGYYMHNQVVATDSYEIANIDIDMFESPKLISSELFDLLSVVDDENIDVYTNNEDIIYRTSNCTIVGKLMEGIEYYAIDAINELVHSEFTSFCAVSKQSFVQLLDRLSLFVGPYDNNGIHLTFTKDGLQVSSCAANGVELIKYVASEDFTDYTCMVDVYGLMKEIKAVQSDVINIYYGNDSGLKLTDGNIIIIISMLDEE